MKIIQAEIVQLALSVLTEEMKLENNKYSDNVKPKIEAEIAEKRHTIRKLSLLAKRLQ